MQSSVYVYVCTYIECVWACVCMRVCLRRFRVVRAVFLLAGDRRPYQLHCSSLLLQPEPCYPFVDITGCLSFHLHIFFNFSELRLLFTRLHHDITVDRPGATSVRTVYTCFLFYSSH